MLGTDIVEAITEELRTDLESELFFRTVSSQLTCLAKRADRRCSPERAQMYRTLRNRLNRNAQTVAEFNTRYGC